MNVQYFSMAIDKRHLRICDKHQISGYLHVVAHLTICKEKDKDQASIQSSTTPGRGTQYRKVRKTDEKATHGRIKRSVPLPAVITRLQGTDKTSLQIQT